MKFCEKVKEARTKAGLKQDEFAKASAFLCGQYRIMRLAPATRKRGKPIIRWRKS